MTSTSSTSPYHLRVVEGSEPEGLLTDDASQTWQPTQLMVRTRAADLYLARPSEHGTLLDSDYVLKRIRQPAASDPIIRTGFRDEVAVGRSVSHPHLIPVLGAHTQDERPFLVMPRIVGQSLQRVVSRVGALPVPHALWIARQIAEALQELHRAGWLHGDVKPANIVVDAMGHATLVDLGSVMRRHELTLGFPSWERPLIGTLVYVAPEMLVSHARVDVHADMYSLGATLFHLLTGRPPFLATQPAELAHAHLHERCPDVRNFVVQIPSDISRLVQRLLAKEPIRRPNAMSEMIEQLVQLEIETLNLRWTQQRPA